MTISPRYDAWGSRIASTGAPSLYGYTGREPDETGLIYYRARYYDPSLGRFVQRDPLGLRGDRNPYSYVNGGPVNAVDPDGHLATIWHRAITFGVAMSRGYGFGESYRLASEVVAVDKNTMNESMGEQQKHAAGGYDITTEGRLPVSGRAALREAQAGSDRDSAEGNRAGVIHRVQDLPIHKGELFPGFGGQSLGEKVVNGLKSILHLILDLFPSPSVVSQAWRNTNEAMEALESGARVVLLPDGDVAVQLAGPNDDHESGRQTMQTVSP